MTLKEECASRKERRERLNKKVYRRHKGLNWYIERASSEYYLIPREDKVLMGELCEHLTISQVAEKFEVEPIAVALAYLEKINV